MCPIKVLAIQLIDDIETMVHEDQAGFIPKRTIEENGAIVALDQEKAYDKIRHDYLWSTQNAHTRVGINGMLSHPFKITRGVRQGDPLSCALFNLAIEPLACKLREDPILEGLKIPGIEEKIIVTMFADDTNLYLRSNDRMDHAQAIHSVLKHTEQELSKPANSTNRTKPH